MRDGFLKTAVATPHIRVADPEYNADQIIDQAEVMASDGVKLMVFPELAISGYTCGDLFLSDSLIEACKVQLKRIADETSDCDALIFAGLPVKYAGKLYNAAAAIHRGIVIGMVPKTFLPNYSEFYEMRHFSPGFAEPQLMDFFGLEIPFGVQVLFENGESLPGLCVAAEICEDAWTPNPPSIGHAMAGANVIVNLSASDEVIGKDSYRRQLVSQASASRICAYLYASAGEGESSQDLVFGGHDIIAENGTILAESKLFQPGYVTAELDIGRLNADRRRMNTFTQWESNHYWKVPFLLDECETRLKRQFAQTPFVPASQTDRAERCEQILSIQSMGLKKRYEHTGLKDAVVGLSGGLDSTLALMVTVRAFDLLKLPRDGVHAVTMPCFGTTDRTYDNACSLAKALGVDLIEVDIKDSVRRHMSDIGQDESVHDVTYENCQARERTQVLMDLANRKNGLVIGTGDMSELALGWATYNGDHMSMYGVNAGVPKTLVRHLVKYCADTAEDQELSKVLRDIVDTPVSPELLPPENGVISQKTEELVGPYELHDFFLYYMMRFNYSPRKIYRLAELAFAEEYEPEIILKWLKTFVRRFFAQQFKRSCLPDGPKVGTVALSPRGDLRMPSDASAEVWMKEIRKLENSLHKNRLQNFVS